MSKLNKIFGGLILAFASCEPYEFPRVGAESGNIRGVLTLFDEGPTQLASSAGVRVSLEGTDPLIFAVSDDFGRFEMKNVPFGEYVVVYEKEGFGTYKYFGDEKTGILHSKEKVNTALGNNPFLGKKSTTQIKGVKIEKVQQGYRFEVRTDPSGNYGENRYVIFFISRESNEVSPRNFETAGKYNCDSNPCIWVIPTEVMESYMNPQTGKAFLRFYGTTFYENYYIGPDQKFVYPNLNPVSSEVITLEKQ
jgi:hypothetical protein